MSNDEKITAPPTIRILVERNGVPAFECAGTYDGRLQLAGSVLMSASPEGEEITGALCDVVKWLSAPASIQGGGEFPRFIGEARF